MVGADFVTYDDPKYVTENPVTQQGLSPENVTRAFGTILDANWIPLVWISLMLDRDLYGLDPAGYHVTNVLFHAGATLLLFAALARMTRSPWRSLFVAGLFALHPLHVQSVAWIAERKDVMSGFFFMAALLAYARYLERRTAGRYATVALAMGLSLLCKATAVTLPFVLLLLDAWPGGRLRELRARPGRAWAPLAEKLPLLALSAAASAVTLATQSQAGAVQRVGFSLDERLANALLSYVAYLRKTLWPADLSFFYRHGQPGLGAPEVLAAAALLALLTAAAVGWARRSSDGHPVCVGWLWYLGTLVPMIGIVQVGGQAMADRYMYIPLVGLGIAAAWVLPPHVLDRVRPLRAGAAGVALAVLAACTVATHREAGFWEDSESLYERAIALDPENYIAHFELARHLNHVGRAADAEAHAREAIRLLPWWEDAYLNLGAALMAQGRDEEAVVAFRRAVARNPQSREARLRLAVSLIRLERFDQARPHLGAVVAAAPGDRATRLSLASVEQALGNREVALAHYDRVWRTAPASPEAAAAAARLAALVDGWPDAPPRWVTQAQMAAAALAATHPEMRATAARLEARQAPSGHGPEKPLKPAPTGDD